MLEHTLATAIQHIIFQRYTVPNANIIIEKTPKNFDGDYTLIIFPLLQYSKQPPAITAQTIGTAVQKKHPELIATYTIVKGFLNFTLQDSALFNALKNHCIHAEPIKQNAKTCLVEFSSPNTNKPLHLGHIRNNLLGDSISKILSECGLPVKKIQIINDRGIHICKSMLAWKRFGQGETPASSKLKGDHLVGKYYVEYEKHYRAEIQHAMHSGRTQIQAEAESKLNQEAQKMLRLWEENDPETITLWKKMNQWVYAGFDATYQKLGITFDKNYFESQTYLLGKRIIQTGLAQKIFYKKEDLSLIHI